MTYMLRGTIERGTGVAARALGRPAAAEVQLRETGFPTRAGPGIRALYAGPDFSRAATDRFHRL